MKRNHGVADLLSLLFRPIRTNGAFFVFMYLLGLVCAYGEVHPWAKPYEWAALELFLDIYVLCVVLTLLPRRLRVWVRRLLYVFFYALAIVDVYCFVKFKSTLNPTMLLLAAETDSREAGEFLATYLTPDILLTRFVCVPLVMALHAAVALTARRLRRRKGYRRSNLSILCEGLGTLLSRLSPVLGVVSAALVVWGAIVCAPNKQATARLMSYGKIGDVERELTRKDCANLYEPVYRLAFSIHANRIAARQLQTLARVADEVSVDSCSYLSPHIVLIIGESYNKRHSQLYGYDKPTTPRQLSRAEKGELVAYSDVITPWNLTSYVFKYLFSTQVVGEKGDWCDYPLVTELFRRAGYHVTFITNQFLPKARDAVYDFSGGFFLNDPKLSREQFDERNERLHVFDEDLLKDHDDILKKRIRGNDTLQYKGELTIFHLIGQHVNYRIRCPKSKMKFRKDDYDRPDLSPKERQVLAYYDNATLYNDSICDAIIRRFEQQDAIILYVPDHGEEVYGKGNEHHFGRIHTSEIDKRLADEEFRVPFWIWMSPSYRAHHPEIAYQVEAAKDRKFMTDALPHLLLYLGGVSTKSYQARYNLISVHYDEKRPRLMKLSVDYDKLPENP